MEPSTTDPAEEQGVRDLELDDAVDWLAAFLKKTVQLNRKNIVLSGDPNLLSQELILRSIKYLTKNHHIGQGSTKFP